MRQYLGDDEELSTGEKNARQAPGEPAGRVQDIRGFSLASQHIWGTLRFFTAYQSFTQLNDIIEVWFGFAVWRVGTVPWDHDSY